VNDSQEQIRRAMREMGEEFSKAMDAAGGFMRQAMDDMARLVGEPRPPRPRPGGPPPTEVIRELGRLRDEGFITEEEFQSKKSELLERL
jgi:hypothetical protein